jgi:hypothetical protein
MIAQIPASAEVARQSGLPEANQDSGLTRPSTTMADSERRQALPFSAAEKALQGPPYLYTSAKVPLTENPAEWVFYQSWTDERVKSINVDVNKFHLT